MTTELDSLGSFEYVMVIVSIIMGMAVATILKGIVSMIRADTPVKPGLLLAIWVSTVLIQHITLWSLRWAGERREDWPFLVLLTFLLLPIFFYAQAELLFPPEGQAADLNEYFVANHRGFLALAILGNLGAAFGISERHLTRQHLARASSARRVTGPLPRPYA
jgi:hypothetical protein